MQKTTTMISLREMCSELGISRRAVQGYEAHGLLSPSGRTIKGHLLYDKEAQQRVKQIHKYQKYGFGLKEIAPLLDAPDEVLRAALEEKLTVLEQKNCEIKKIIKELRGDIEKLK